MFNENGGGNMLINRKLLNCDVEIDNDKTEQWYAQAEEWGCECENCLNFLRLPDAGCSLPTSKIF